MNQAYRSRYGSPSSIVVEARTKAVSQQAVFELGAAGAAVLVDEHGPVAGPHAREFGAIAAEAAGGERAVEPRDPIRNWPGPAIAIRPVGAGSVARTMSGATCTGTAAATPSKPEPSSTP